MIYDKSAYFLFRVCLISAHILPVIYRYLLQHKPPYVLCSVPCHRGALYLAADGGDGLHTAYGSYIDNFERRIS
jgi:hypothetical protein